MGKRFHEDDDDGEEVTTESSKSLCWRLILVDESINQAQLDLLLSGAFSDMTIKCRGREWKAHTCILFPRCAMFRASFDGFKVMAESIPKGTMMKG